MSIFISYSSADEEYAIKLERSLRNNHYKTWFAPKDIAGGESFITAISKELSKHKSTEYEDRIAEDREHLQKADYFILLLSANSMKSKWVEREFIFADKKSIPMQILKIDNCRLSDSFTFMLGNTQITEAYHLGREQLKAVIEKIRKDLPFPDPDATKEKRAKRLSYKQIGIFPISSGDPYFTIGETLLVTLGKGRYFLSPPKDFLTDSDCSGYLSSHKFQNEDIVFNSTLDKICSEIPIEELRSMIEESRRKIFLQFLHQENGCYFNNQKYGVAHISRFERTEDLTEQPILRIEMFLTDYFTHRVMKDVCKQLAVTHRRYLQELNLGKIHAEKILFTSLGVNMLLCEAGEKVILTSRSTNAAETYNRHSYSLSVIEGISISDYDTFTRSINLEYAVYRGLKEELGVDDSYVQKDSLKFYDMFINPANLEMGLSCSLDLKKGITLEKDIIPLHGKDEILEVSGKRIINVKDLSSFIYNNMAAMNPQTVYTICTYLETLGVFMLDRHSRVLVDNVKSVIPKEREAALCGDTYVWGENYIAVIDGATPKGEILWDGQKGDVYVSHLVADAIVEMDPDYTAQEAVMHINGVVRKAYADHGIEFSQLLPAERLQCSILIYSMRRYEVWSFGDCMLRINQRDFVNIKEGDRLFSALRAFCIQIERDRLGKKADESVLSLYGREQILPYLKAYTSLANRNVPFGYDVIDGGKINPDHVQIYAVQRDDCVVMASDGYPKLFDTLEETEVYLKNALEADPICVGLLRGTKGIDPGNVSYDDRTYVSFRVK